MSLILLLIIIVVILCALYLYGNFKSSFNYWKKLNVPYLPPIFPNGNLNGIFERKHFAYIAQELYERSKCVRQANDYIGIFFFKSPALMILTPEFAKTILIKDFQYFVDRGVYFNKIDDPLSANLFFIEGNEWRLLRSKISPTFTSGKMKMMFHVIHSIGQRLCEHIQDTITTTTTTGMNSSINGTFEVRDLLARYTTDVIGSCAFGLECNSIENPDAEFRQMGKKMFTFSKLKTLKMFFGMLFRDTARNLHFRINEEEITQFVTDIVKSTIKYRRENNVRRNDFLQLMIDMYKEPITNDKNNNHNNHKTNDSSQQSEDCLTLNEISAQVFVFFFAGFETSSTTIAYALYELALNPEIQDRARNEILTIINNGNNNNNNNGEITYESINEMSYLDQIFNETLRKYPAVATIHRVALKDYQLPNDGAIIPKGTNILLPTYGFHMDEKYFPEPQQFNPDRFNELNRAKRHPLSHLPFGEGPRICVGMRFGILQTKLAISMLLKQFRFTVCEKTEIPLIIDPVNLLYVPLAGVHLQIENIN